MSRQNVEELITKSGGRVLIQELINWSGAYPEDCLTMFTKDSGQPSEPVHLYNVGFMDEANTIKEFHSHYSTLNTSL